MQRHTHRHADGFVLLMALLLIVVAGMTMAGAARVSLGRSMQAKAAADGLQLRWGQLSCQAALLPQARELLEQTQQDSLEPVASVPITVSLGGVTFEVLVADEQAKININTLYQRTDRQTTEQSIKDVLRQSEGPPVMVKLHPLKSQGVSVGTESPIMAGFGSLEQAFDATAAELIGSATDPNPASRLFTCWGDGKLNFHRAPRVALRAICAGLLNDREVERLMTARQITPDLSLEQALNTLALTKEKQGKLANLLTDTSSWFSLWIVARDERRAWHRLTVFASTQPEGGEFAAPGDNQKVDAVFMW